MLSLMYVKKIHQFLSSTKKDAHKRKKKKIGSFFLRHGVHWLHWLTNTLMYCDILKTSGRYAAATTNPDSKP